ncbi:MAG: GPO family capsid scaffolding protein [Marinobacterium sp.]|nr:GPO family capsid scaffolding protein [Marinobacterium sp.]
MPLKSKYFRVAVEGDTTDGRVIERSWIEQMAASYNRQKYTARVNCEHFRSMWPGGEFGAYGTVLDVKTDNVTIDGKERLALLASIEPTSDLVALNRRGQKLFTSIEVNPAFAGGDQAYLVGLAITDSPASLGTEMLQFAAGAQQNPLADRKQHPDNLFTAATEVTLEISDETSVVDRVKAMFNKNDAQQQQHNDQFSQAIEIMATEVASIRQDMNNLQGNTGGDNTPQLQQLSAELQSTQADLASLKTQLSQLPNFSSRPPAAGGDNTSDVQTDC